MMKNKDHPTQTKRGGTQSSITVSRKVVCQDEACIGKRVAAKDLSAADPSEDDKQHANALGTSISIGGKQVCIDDACIGRK